WKPARKEDQLDRHGRNVAPRGLAIKRKQDAREHIGFEGTAPLQDFRARACHVRRIGVVADHLEREVGLYGRGYVERAAVEKGPAAMRRLPAAEIGADLALEFEVWRLGEIMNEQNVF